MLSQLLYLTLKGFHYHIKSKTIAKYNDTIIERFGISLQTGGPSFIVLSTKGRLGNVIVDSLILDSVLASERPLFLVKTA
jgi:hypothetical protein